MVSHYKVRMNHVKERIPGGKRTRKAALIGKAEIAQRVGEAAYRFKRMQPPAGVHRRGYVRDAGAAENVFHIGQVAGGDDDLVAAANQFRGDGPKVHLVADAAAAFPGEQDCSHKDLLESLRLYSTGNRLGQHPFGGRTPEVAWEGKRLPPAVTFRARDESNFMFEVWRGRCRGDPRLPVIHITRRAA